MKFTCTYYIVPLITKIDVIPTYSTNETSSLLQLLTRFMDSTVCGMYACSKRYDC